MNVFCCFVFRPFQQTLTQLLLLLFGMGAHVNLLYLAWMRLLFLLALLSILCCFYCCFLLALFVSSELFTLIVEAEFCNQLLCPAPLIRMPHEQAPTCRFPFRCAAHILQKLTPVATSLTIPAKVALTPIHITCIASSQFCVSLFLFFFYQTPNTILLLPYCRFAFRILLSTRRRLAFLLRTYANLAWIFTRLTWMFWLQAKMLWQNGGNTKWKTKKRKQKSKNMFACAYRYIVKVSTKAAELLLMFNNNE